ncbi:HAMP domain-containing protein [Phreatobacter aquaticus]|uniref:histidine kinase n=1 Tax=Phreatobacter aquaticus TaxID=2570229 RepID=A0A4D7QKD9_9HYPH|nr:sensor histidine kinase [Phreatobacter aquaticus]QCK85707.1 HAMP domain-containing protein [Phreatobacter aquaticus]
MLDRTPESALHDRDAVSHEPRPPLVMRVGAAISQAGRSVVDALFSSLTRRIVLLNLVGLVALVSGILWLSQFRAGLIESRAQSLLVQGEIIAGAIAASAAVDGSVIPIDPDKLFELQLGGTGSSVDDPAALLEFPINPERVAPVLRRLTGPTETQARIYDREGTLILDSRNLYGRGDITALDLPPIGEKPPFYVKWWNEVRRFVRGGSNFPIYRDLGFRNGKSYPEVAQALNGQKASMVRVNDAGEVIVSVAIPVQRFRGVLGVLLLNTRGGEIDAVLDAERFQVLRVFLIAAFVMVVLSILMARTIGGPVRQLADAAEKVRRRHRSREEIPDFTQRRDEIGHLSQSLRDMTEALYARIEAIERFAADVAHELKNPLTSLRSAVETMPLAKTDASRTRLLEVIQHDVRRLDRLITDISDASRLDAELQRQESARVDMSLLLSTLVTIANEVKNKNGTKVKLTFEGGKPADFAVPGHDSRLSQVVTNLIDNARSFSPEGGTVSVTARKLKGAVEVIVDDNGPGIRPDALERIFERFYTDRPHQDYGQNSGLGLSISKQVVDAHGGRIWAENRLGPLDADGEPTVLGARFVVRLPSV